MNLEIERLSEQRRHVHAYVDRLPENQLSAICGLLETMLSPLDRHMALGGVDDEPMTAEDLAAIQAGIASLDAGRVETMEAVFADFGLTTSNFYDSDG